MSIIDEPRVHRFTRDEYYAMAEAGLFYGRRVELIEGEIIDMAPQKNTHVFAVDKTHEALCAVFPSSKFWVRNQSPIVVADGSEPEPDIAVVRGPRASHQQKHPTSAILVVEVSDTTYRFDRTVKADLYAKAGIPEYWIVNLIDDQLEVRRDPVLDADGKWSYTSVHVFSAAESVTPLAMPNTRVAVADLLP